MIPSDHTRVSSPISTITPPTSSTITTAYAVRTGQRSRPSTGGQIGGGAFPSAVPAGIAAERISSESPYTRLTGVGPALANNNQVGVIVQANSGLPYNIRSNRDLNLDGITDADRPNGIARNSGTLGTFATVDLRYSRFVPLSGARRVEGFAEVKNLFNHKNTRAVNSVVTTDTLGNPVAPIPSEFPVTTVYESRQLQLGLKVSF
jgi:hypothetical protein